MIKSCMGLFEWLEFIKDFTIGMLDYLYSSIIVTDNYSIQIHFQYQLHDVGGEIKSKKEIIVDRYIISYSFKGDTKFKKYFNIIY